MIQELSKLFTSLLMLQVTEQELKNASKPKLPEPPPVITSDEEWEQYQKQVRQYNDDTYSLQQKIDKAERAANEKRKELLAAMPAHSWWRLEDTVKNTFHWVGYENDDWPMSTPTLQIFPGDKPKEELPVLKFRHTSIN